MNRLKVRKKMAVFISLVLVIQMVVGNVAFAAEGGRIEFDKNNVKSFKDSVLEYDDGIKVTCAGLAAKSGDTSFASVNTLDEYTFESSFTSASIVITVTVPNDKDENFLGLNIGGEDKEKGQPTNTDTSSEKVYIITYNGNGVTDRPTQVRLNYSNQTSQPGGTGDSYRIEIAKDNVRSFSDGKITLTNGITVENNDANNKIVASVPKTVSGTECVVERDNDSKITSITNFDKMTSDEKGKSHFEIQGISSSEEKSVTFKVTVSSEKDSQFKGLIFNNVKDSSNPLQVSKGNAVDNSGNKEYTITQTIPAGQSNMINVNIWDDSSGSGGIVQPDDENKPVMGTEKLGLTIGTTKVIENGEITSNGIQGLVIEKKEGDYRISVKKYTDNSDEYVVVDGEGRKKVKLRLDCFTFTGNGNVELDFTNDMPGFEPDCIVDIESSTEETTSGYSIYDTDGVNLQIKGSWDTEVKLQGGIYSSYGLEVVDLKQMSIGTSETYSDKGIIGNTTDKHNPEVILQTNINVYTNDRVFSDFYKLRAMNGANVACVSSKDVTSDTENASIVSNINSIFIKDGGGIRITANGTNAQIANDENDIKNVTSTYFASQTDPTTGLYNSNDEKYVNCTANNNDNEVAEGKYIYNYSGYTSNSFYLKSTTKKQMSIYWKEVIEDYTEGMNLDKYVYNGKLEIKAIQGGVRREDSSENVDYTFAEGSEVIFKLVPNPGYEYVPGTFSFNGGNGTVVELNDTEKKANGEIGIYKYKMGNRPVHIGCVFKKSNNKVSSDSTLISNETSSVKLSDEAKSTINGSLSLEIGNAELTDTQVDNIKKVISNSNYTVNEAVNLNLNQEIAKMTVDAVDKSTDGNEKWVNPLKELESDSEGGINNKVTITLGLDDELQGKDDYTIVREHTTGSGESSVTEYETIEPTIDRTNNTITFETNKFSTYAIAYKGTYTPTPAPIITPAPTATPEPTVAPTPTPEPTQTPTVAPSTPTMAPVSEEVSESVNKEVNTVVEEITKGNDTTVVDSTTADKIKEAVEQGKEIVTEIVTDTVKQEEVSKTEVQKITNEIKQMVAANTTTVKQSIVNVAQYINLEIVLKAGEEKLGNLTQLKEPVEFTIAVPEKLKVKNRKFFVIRVHNGVVEILDTVTNEDGTLSFKTDRFSTYALAYEDEVAKPAVVKKVKLATRGTNSLKISWDKVTGATGYRVYVVKDGKWTRVDETKLNTYIYKNLSSGKSYKFAVKPYKVVNGKTIWANTYTPLTTCTKPALVKSIKATTSKRTYVTTTWSKVAGASRYRVYIVKGGKWVRLGTTKYNKFTFKGLKKNTKYKIAVRPVKLDGKTEVLAYTYTASYIKTKK